MSLVKLIFIVSIMHGMTYFKSHACSRILTVWDHILFESFVINKKWAHHFGLSESQCRVRKG